jgi:hypothetical protein
MEKINKNFWLFVLGVVFFVAAIFLKPSLISNILFLFAGIIFTYGYFKDVDEIVKRKIADNKKDKS